MELKWTARALSDLSRLHDFLAPVNPLAAAVAIRSLVTAPTRLLENPRIGMRLEEFGPRDVRRFLVGRYEIRSEIVGSTIVVLRLWHTREDR
jgi:plasmid stabilization system protein ParE